jgi:hypothetical protein
MRLYLLSITESWISSILGITDFCQAEEMRDNYLNPLSSPNGKTFLWVIPLFDTKAK